MICVCYVPLYALLLLLCSSVSTCALFSIVGVFIHVKTHGPRSLKSVS